MFKTANNINQITQYLPKMSDNEFQSIGFGETMNASYLK